ncbi:MAG: c-type cytochrome [Polyangiales bacterium]
MNRSINSMFGAAVACALAAGCSDAASTPPATNAAAYYSSLASSALGATSNTATCASCHSNDGTPRSGETLRNIAYHTSFKGGMAPTLLMATNACVTGWMGGTALTETDPRWLSLQTYMRSISSPEFTTPNTMIPEVLANEAAYESTYAGGDATAGAPLYARYCGTCHSVGTTVNTARATSRAGLRSLSVGRIAQQVRTSGPPPSGAMDSADSTPGPMPFFEPDELPPADLRNIIAYVRSAM